VKAKSTSHNCNVLFPPVPTKCPFSAEWKGCRVKVCWLLQHSGVWNI